MLNYKPKILDQYYKKYSNQKGFGLFHVLFLPFMHTFFQLMLSYFLMLIAFIISGHIINRFIDFLCYGILIGIHRCIKNDISNNIKKYGNKLQQYTKDLKAINLAKDFNDLSESIKNRINVLGNATAINELRYLVDMDINYSKTQINELLYKSKYNIYGFLMLLILYILSFITFFSQLVL